MKPEDIERIKDLLPTDLGSDEIRGKFAADILRRSVFSARMASAHYLAKVREVCAEILSGTINEATARTRLMACLAEMGHSPLDDDGLTNPASVRRLNLIIDTQRQMAASVSRLMQQDEGTVEQFPGWELCRMGSRMMPRQDWLARWNRAGESVHWKDAVRHPIYGDANAFGFLALKSSPIWAALGNGVGGFRDTLGNPYPPFAYSSGMAWMDADRETCERYGLISPDSPADMPETPSLSPGEKDILEAVDRYGFDFPEDFL